MHVHHLAAAGVRERKPRKPGIPIGCSGYTTTMVLAVVAVACSVLFKGGIGEGLQGECFGGEWYRWWCCGR